MNVAATLPQLHSHCGPGAGFTGIHRVSGLPRPCDLDLTVCHYVNFPAYPPALTDRLGNLDTTVILSETAAGLRPTRSYDDSCFPI